MLHSKITPLPWYATGVHVQSAAVDEDNYVCRTEGDTDDQAVANAQLIVRSVNLVGEALLRSDSSPADDLSDAFYALLVAARRAADQSPEHSDLRDAVKRADNYLASVARASAAFDTVRETFQRDNTRED